MILTVGHTKGGVGKSTLALNIAIERLRAGVETLIVDGDPKQTSISKAIGIRADAGLAPAVPCIVLDDAKALRHQIGLLKSKYQNIVIDVGGKDSNSLRAALTVTDALLLPIALNQLKSGPLTIFSSLAVALPGNRHYPYLCDRSFACPGVRASAEQFAECVERATRPGPADESAARARRVGPEARSESAPTLWNVRPYPARRKQKPGPPVPLSLRYA